MMEEEADRMKEKLDKTKRKLQEWKDQATAEKKERRSSE
ncbi:hypothetical protein BCON_0014g00830 [Botryotinia convoluta]|uniref:Uncharacterized protein n=1 Tax=Botryotinia convoluta TaxID=54673 RepID=A0A4Z1IRI5_9HELO|nr:hypothetical protein BCON_0014g00830 [Botryotinia convoluta]